MVSIPTVSFAQNIERKSVQLYPTNHTAPKQTINALKARSLVSYIVDEYKIPERNAKIIVDTAIKHSSDGITPELILAVIGVESSFKERVISSHGARGLMQVLASSHPEKVKGIGGIKALHDPKKNILVGANILAEYREVSNGNLRKTLLRYNGSLNNRKSKYPDKVIQKLRDIKRISKEKQKEILLAQN